MLSSRFVNQVDYPCLDLHLPKKSSWNVLVSLMSPHLFFSHFLAFVFSTFFLIAERPNIVFILADDCSYLDMELYGGPAKTPHINKLAKTGMTFSRCYQSSPMCSPTRHALYTGIHPVKNGAYPNHGRAYENIKSVPHYLSRANYQVILAGKRHIEPVSVFPFQYLDEFAEPSKEEVLRVDGWRYPRIFEVMKDSKTGKKSFCLFLCSNEPHGPYTKGDPRPYQTVKLSPQQLEFHRQSYANYLAEITYFDGQVGEILQMMDELDLRKKTLVLVASEQGSSYPFGKWTCYEMGVASGLVASWPGIIKNDTKSDAIIEYVDVLPTLLEAIGLNKPCLLDGDSFLSILRGIKKTHKKYAYSIQTTLGVNGAEQAYGIRSVVDERFRYVLNLFPENEFDIPSSRKLLEETKDLGGQEIRFAQRYVRRPREELFDVLSDPYCLNNLVEKPQYHERKKLLSKVLEKWMVKQNDQGQLTEWEAESRQSAWRQRQRTKTKIDQDEPYFFGER